MSSFFCSVLHCIGSLLHCFDSLLHSFPPCSIFLLPACFLFSNMPVSTVPSFLCQRACSLDEQSCNTPPTCPAEDCNAALGVFTAPEDDQAGVQVTVSDVNSWPGLVPSPVLNAAQCCQLCKQRNDTYVMWLMGSCFVCFSLSVHFLLFSPFDDVA